MRIFNQGGMEIFAFGDDADLGRPVGAVALPDGDMVILAYGVDGYAVVRCNFRGEPIRKLTLSGAPAGFLDDFHPGAIALANDKLFLADLRAMTVLVSDLEGKVVASHDLAKLLEVEARRQELGVRGFNVDKDGNILFTVQPLFRAFVLAPDGTEICKLDLTAAQFATVKREAAPSIVAPRRTPGPAARITPLSLCQSGGIMAMRIVVR